VYHQDLTSIVLVIENCFMKAESIRSKSPCISALKAIGLLMKRYAMVSVKVFSDSGQIEFRNRPAFRSVDLPMLARQRGLRIL